MPHGGHGGGGGGHGIEGMTPPTGPLTSFAGVGMFVGALHFAWRHPRSAALGFGLATAFTFAGGSEAGTALTSPLALLFAIVAGCSIAGDSNPVTSTHAVTTRGTSRTIAPTAPRYVTTPRGRVVPTLTAPRKDYR